MSRLASVLAVTGCVASAGAAETRCPAQNGGAALVSVMLFDGPLSEHADLAPDGFTPDAQGGHSDWDVAYVYQAGRKVFVKCEYGAKIAPIVVEPASTTAHCVFRPGVGAGASLVCLGK